MKKLFLFLLLFPSFVSAAVIEIEKDGIKYILDTQNLNAEVTFYGEDYIFAQNQYEGSVVIPGIIAYSGNSFVVTTIGEGAFYYCDKIESIQLPNTLLEIGAYAFSGCVGLKEIELPESIVKIGDNAFTCCTGLTAIKLPNGLRSINNNLFLGCSSLRKINVPNNCTFIGESAFGGCKLIEELLIPETVMSIGKKAFKECTHLNKITLPPYLRCIEDGLFSGCHNLLKVVIPDGVETIGESAFENDSILVSINIGNKILSIGDKAFKNCKHLAELDLPRSVKKIGKSSFSGCTSLQALKLDNGIIEIEDETFCGCYALRDINIPSSVTTIGKLAFNECRSITSMFIPEGVDSISDAAFEGCSKLESVSFPSTLKRIGKETFKGCKIKFIVTYSAKVLFEDAFSDNTLNHAILYIPNGKWQDAIYNGGWYLFRNIREIELDTSETKESMTYSIMNSRSFDYVICIDENNAISSTVGYDEFNVNDIMRCWQIKKNGEDVYLINIGVNKYISGYDGTSFLLTDIGKPADIVSTDSGIMISGDSSKWYLVRNGNSTSGIDVLCRDKSQKVVYITTNGVTYYKPHKGINLVKDRGKIKKVIIK